MSQQFDSGHKRREAGSHLFVEHSDVGVQEVDVAQDAPGHPGVVGAVAAR
jgi:hypothetical protein